MRKENVELDRVGDDVYVLINPTAVKVLFYFLRRSSQSICFVGKKAGVFSACLFYNWDKRPGRDLIEIVVVHCM